MKRNGMMKRFMVTLCAAVLSVGLVFNGGGTAYAQWAVVDVKAVPQWIKQLADNVKQLAELKRQYEQLKSQFESITGNRNFGQLLMTLSDRGVFNSIPAEHRVYLQDALAVSDQVNAISSKIRDMQRDIAFLIGASFPDMQSPQAVEWQRAVEQLARKQAIGQNIYDQGGQRINQIDQLTAAISSTDDLKGSMELGARINAYQAQIMNEQNRLIALKMIQDAEEETLRRQQAARVQSWGKNPLPTLEFPGQGAWSE